MYRIADASECSECGRLVASRDSYLAGGTRTLCHTCHVFTDIRRHVLDSVSLPKRRRALTISLTVGALFLTTYVYMLVQTLANTRL
jgi:hypothetical protein